MHQTKISTKTDKHGFSPAVSSSRLEQKTPVTEYLVSCVCVLYSMVKYVLRMGSCVRFCCNNILFLLTKSGEGSAWSVLKSFVAVRRVIPLANRKLTFGERISCIKRDDDFSPRSHRAVSLKVGPFQRV